jgi:integrase/recombinase XerD
MKFENHLNSLKDHLFMNNYSKKTITTYSGKIKEFLVFLENQFPRINSISEITKDIIYNFLNYQTSIKNKKGNILTSGTIKTKLISLRIFFRYLMKQDFILNNPVNLIDLPRVEKRLPRNILSEDEVKKLLTSMKTNSPIKLRNRAIVELLYSTGIRPSELCDIKIPDIDLKEQILIIVKGKGNKTRYVPVGQHAIYYIEQYLATSRKHLLKGKVKDEGYLFLASSGSQLKGCLINKCLFQILKNNDLINKKISCYTFRHSIATHLIKNKVDIRYVGQLLGHESLTTTQIYCHLEISDLKKMHALYHPREANNESPENIT